MKVHLISLIVSLIPLAIFAQEPASAPTCGNGALEPGEACDDGNMVSGDGCRSDCLGYEKCGDGVLDYGEVCDDGNVMDGDSCAPACDILLPVEAQSQPSSQPASTPASSLPSEVDPTKHSGEKMPSGSSPISWPPSALPSTPSKSPAIAQALAGGATALGYALLLSAAIVELEAASEGEEINTLGLLLPGIAVIVVGPSAGHLYAGATTHALITSSLRAVSVGAMVLTLKTGGCHPGPLCSRGYFAGLLGGALGVGALTIFDISDASEVIGRKKADSQSQADSQSLRISLLPLPLVNPDGRYGAGMVLEGSF
jgi:cysteine-rich repeat protein